MGCPRVIRPSSGNRTADAQNDLGVLFDMLADGTVYVVLADRLTILSVV